MTSLFSVARVAKVAALTLGATAAIACSDSTGSVGPQGLVQLINAAPQQSKIDMHIGAAAAVNDLPYGQVSQLYVHASDTTKVFGVYDSTSTSLFETQNITVADGVVYTLALVQAGITGTGTDLLYFPDTVSAPSSGHAKIRIVNGSPSTASLDLYLLPVGTGATELNAATPVATAILYKASFPYTEITSGSYRLVLTTVGTKTAVVDLSPLSFAAGGAVTFFTVNNSSSGTGVSALYWSDL